MTHDVQHDHAIKLWNTRASLQPSSAGGEDYNARALEWCRANIVSVDDPNKHPDCKKPCAACLAAVTPSSAGSGEAAIQRAENALDNLARLHGYELTGVELSEAVRAVARALRSPDAAATPPQPAFLKSLQHTLNVMKKAHASGGDRWMSIWTEDVQAVEEAIAALDAAQRMPDRDAIAAIINDRTMINDEGFVQNSEAVADAILALSSPEGK